MFESAPHRQIASVLRHERKTNTYKVALIRALGDLALAFPDLGGTRADPRDVALPLRSIAEFWLAYYWPFCDPAAPVLQGTRAVDRRTGALRQDVTFRIEIEALREAWEHTAGPAAPADGYLLVEEMRSERRRAALPEPVCSTFALARRKAAHAIRQPVKYAGQEHWGLFSQPAPLRVLAATRGHLDAVPGTAAHERCIVVGGELWQGFRELSLWVEALAVHAWCLYTEEVDQSSVGREAVRRGEVYEALTARPDNRRPLSWERNGVDLLMLEGHVFGCPWTGRRLTHGAPYDLDHLVPIALYPTNELWNLIPADPHFNQRVKRDRLPTAERLWEAEPRLSLTYERYLRSRTLGSALTADARGRFLGIGTAPAPAQVADAAIRIVAAVADARNAPRFS